MTENETKTKTYPSWETTEVLSLRVPKGVMDDLESEAETQGKSRNKVAAEILEEALSEKQS